MKKVRPELLEYFDSHNASPLTDDPPQDVMDKWTYGIHFVILIIIGFFYYFV